MSRPKNALWLLSAAMIASFTCGCRSASQSQTPSAEPITLTVWTYYNGDQLTAFNSLVDEFNQTVGAEQGILVENYSQGSINDLETNILAAAEQKVGANDLPNIFSAYADTAYALDQMGIITDLSAYMTYAERSAYIDGYLKEGDFLENGSIKIFPIAKSTELLFLNETDWEPFAQETGVTYQNFETIEGLVETAELYYNWTDAQTEEPNDGRALFGRDAMANYMLAGAKQLGCTIFDVENEKMTLNFDKQVIRRLWDSYYVPFIKGYFAASGLFRSDDIKTGNIIAYVGSSSSASFFPSQVVSSDTESYDIKLKVLPAPKFKDGENIAIQQGAGMAVTNQSEEEIAASVTFLKWLTSPDHNMKFSIDAGYLPVTKYASSMDHILTSGITINSSQKEILTVALDTINFHDLYTTNAFPGGKDARQVLNYALSDQASHDRAIVEERIQQGMDPEKAEAEFLSDETFETWYENTLNVLTTFQD